MIQFCINTSKYFKTMAVLKKIIDECVLNNYLQTKKKEN